MDRLDLEETMYSDVLKENIKGFPESKNYTNLMNNYKIGYVLRGMEYRPDKIAEYYLGDSRKHWMILFANNFTEGIKAFSYGKEIKIPQS